MPIQIRAAKTNKNEEKKILIASIVSTQFLKETPFLRPEIFVIPYSKRIFKWVNSYFKKYDEAPQKTIKDIFNAERNRIDEDEAELIADFLESISSQYANEEDKEIFNSKYAIDNARKYAKQRELELKISEVNGLLSMGNVEEAESSLLNYKKAAIKTSSWVNPLDADFVKNMFENKASSVLFKLPGDLGDFCGPIERGRMYAVQAPLKRGKSFFLSEFKVLAMLNKLNVVEFNLEMTNESVSNRFFKRITAATENPGESLYPIIDCKNSQSGLCKKPERNGKIALYAHEDHIPSWETSNKEYKPCSVCRGTVDFIPTSWYETIYRQELTREFTEKRISAFRKMWGERWRLITYPKFSATVEDLERDLNFLEDSENFIPDIIICDYPALLRSKVNYADKRIQISEIWKMFGGLAALKNCAVVGAAQTNREGGKKSKSTVYDLAESIDIAQDCDAVFTLNQSDQQKRRGIISISVGALRDGAFNESDSVEILTDLAAGQFLLDSYISK